MSEVVIGPAYAFLGVLGIFCYLIFDWLSYRSMKLKVDSLNVLVLYNLHYMTKNFEDYGSMGSLEGNLKEKERE